MCVFQERRPISVSVVRRESITTAYKTYGISYLPIVRCISTRQGTLGVYSLPEHSGNRNDGGYKKGVS